MKLPLRLIALLVGLSLAGVFAYQSWWLVRLYHRETADMRLRIAQAVEYADWQETSLRVEQLKTDSSRRGQIATSASPYSDSTYVETRTIDERTDSMHIEIRRRHVSEHDTTKSVVTRSMSTTTSLERETPDSAMQRLELMAQYLRRGIRTGVNLFLSPVPQRFDSLFTARLWQSGIDDLPHLLEVIDDEGHVTDSISTAGYTPDTTAEQLYYPLDNDTQAAYRISHRPVRSLVLQQMAGILGASLAILFILVAAFAYLIRTMLRMRTLDEMKTDFTNNITHELKTPIAVAYAASDALLSFEATPEKTREYMEVVRSQLGQLGGMVEQILSTSTERQRTLTLHLEDVALRELIDQQARHHQLKAGRPVDISIDIAPDDLTLRADRTHLSNMVGNLLDNAIKYTPDDRTPQVTVYCRKGLVEVSDRGMGIAPSQLPHIWERFYRVPQGNRHDVKGYGLGLYYVSQMMHLHGGTAEAESTPGAGTTIRLRFPQPTTTHLS